MVISDRILPETLPENADPVIASFFAYCRTERGYHPRPVNSNTVWTATTPTAFFTLPLMANIDVLAPRKALLAGADAYSRYRSESAQALAPDNIELLVVPDADHVDLYDRKEVIPLDTLDGFFAKNLAA